MATRQVVMLGPPAQRAAAPGRRPEPAIARDRAPRAPRTAPAAGRRRARARRRSAGRRAPRTAVGADGDVRAQRRRPRRVGQAREHQVGQLQPRVLVVDHSVSAVCERLGEPREGVAGPRLDRAERHVDALGDLGLREPLEVGELDHLAGSRVQRRERHLDAEPLAGAHAPGRPGRARGRPTSGASSTDVMRRRRATSRAALRAIVKIQRGGRAALGVERRRDAPDRRERLLRAVLRRGSSPSCARPSASTGRTSRRQSIRECLGIPLADADEQFAVRRLRRH